MKKILQRIKCFFGFHTWDMGVGTGIGSSPECIHCRKFLVPMQKWRIAYK